MLIGGMDIEGGACVARKEQQGNLREYKSLSRQQFLGKTNPYAHQFLSVRLGQHELEEQQLSPSLPSNPFAKGLVQLE
jgi:hypothetical protein